MSLSNSSALTVYSGITNASMSGFGARIAVGGDLMLSSNAWIYPKSHTTNGGSVSFCVNNLTMLTNAGFNADSGGYGCPTTGNGYGPGGGRQLGQCWGGGGYGGAGGGGLNGAQAGTNYGSIQQPVLPGSSGGYPAR